MKKLLPGLLLLVRLAAGAEIGTPGFGPNDLFQISKVWTVELSFTSAEWEAMKPNYNGPRGPSMLVGAEGSRNGYLAFQGLVYNWAHANVSIGGVKFDDIGVRDKGNGTYMEGSVRGKVSMKLHLNKYVKGQKLAGMSTFNLANNITDAGWMNEELAYRLFRDAGVPAPRSAYAKVYITVAGVGRRYAGLFSLIEDVDDDFIQDRFGSKTGALLKPIPLSLFTYLGDDWKAYNQIYDPRTTLTDAQKSRIIQLCRLATSGSDEEFAAKIGNYIDLDNFARFLAVDVWLSDFDGIMKVGQNYYAYMDPVNGRFRFVAWDHDHSFGQMGRASVQETENFTIYHPWNTANHFMARLFAVPAFRDLYLAKMREFCNTIFQPSRLFKQVDELAPAIRPAIAEEGEQMVRTFDAVVADPQESDQRRMFGERLKPFVKARTPLVINQLNGKSQGDQVETHTR